MMAEWISLCVVISLLLLITGAAFIFYSGLLSDINIQTGSPPIKNITFAYKFKQGPYKNSGELFKESHSIGPELSCIGVFYDDPKKVPGQQCRYAVGSILSEGENKASEELLKRYEKSGFNVFSFPQATHVVTTSFPCRTFLSIFLMVIRVYPRLEQYMKERRLCAHPFLEIYRDGQIQFMAPLARQGDFYIPEAHQVKRRPSAQDESPTDTEISGGDSNSEYSSGSGILLSDSRETSRAPSSVHSVPSYDEGGRDDGEKSSRVSPELSQELTGGQREEREEHRHRVSNQKNQEGVTQEWWGVVGGEE